MKELKKDKEELERSKVFFRKLHEEYMQLITEDKDYIDLLGEDKNGNKLYGVNEIFTIVKHENLPPEVQGYLNEVPVDTQYYPGTNLKWNKFNKQGLMMYSVRDEVNKVIEEATTEHTRKIRKKQNKLIKRLFKKRIVQFEITPYMSEKKKKLTRIANAIIKAARKMKDYNITLDDLMTGKATLED